MGKFGNLIKAGKGAALGCLAVLGTFGVVDGFADETENGGIRELSVVSKSGAEKPTGRKAFLVGASDYSRDVADLPCVKNDVEALAARLIEIGFEEEDVVVLTNGGEFEDLPIKENIETRFQEFVEELQPGDFVVVYLSGHGIEGTASGESFFAPTDIKAAKAFETAVSINEMLRMLEESPAQFRLMIVDACRNDPESEQSRTRSMFKTRAAAPEGVRALAGIEDAPKSVTLLQSCQPGKYSYEGGKDVEHGVFTQSLLEALDPKNAEPNADGDAELTFGEIFTYVSKRTNELAKTLHNASQRPHLNNKDGFTDFVVMDRLQRDGISSEEWTRADGYFQEARKLRLEKKWEAALEKIKEARAINVANQEYAEEETRITDALERERREQADAASERAWAAYNRGATEENIDEAIRLMKQSIALVSTEAKRMQLTRFQEEKKRVAEETARRTKAIELANQAVAAYNQGATEAGVDEAIRLMTESLGLVEDANNRQWLANFTLKKEEFKRRTQATELATQAIAAFNQGATEAGVDQAINLMNQSLNLWEDANNRQWLTSFNNRKQQFEAARRQQGYNNGGAAARGAFWGEVLDRAGDYIPGF